MVKERNIVLCIIFSIITCGIYALYWMAKLQDDSLKAANEEGTSGGLVILFSIITCGIYGFFFAYKLGERTDKIKNKDSNSGILYLVLYFIGLSVINACLTQSELNKHANA